MILNVYQEQLHKTSDTIELKYTDTIEIQRIKEILSENDPLYISDNLKAILNIDKANNMSCFTQKIETTSLNFYRVILYIRLSVEDGDLIDGDVSRSIRNQLLFLLQYCKEKGWKVVAIFCEEGISGADDNRPEWLKSLSFCQAGNTEIMLCKSQSRFSRSMEMIEKYIHKEFQLWHIRFIGVVDSTDTAIKGNKKTRQINGLVNEWQVEDQSINTRAILENKKKMGLFVGSFPPYRLY